MAEMVRKQIYLDKRLDRLLKKQSDRAGVSQAEVIRDALEKVLGPGADDSEARAWKELKLFFEGRAKLKAKPRGRRWTRDELYEERASRKRDG